MDPRNLNKAIRRTHFKLPTREEEIAKISGAKIFSNLDFSKGFSQLQLDKESFKLSTFITPFGISSATAIYHSYIP